MTSVLIIMITVTNVASTQVRLLLTRLASVSQQDPTALYKCCIIIIIINIIIIWNVNANNWIATVLLHYTE